MLLDENKLDNSEIAGAAARGLECCCMLAIAQNASTNIMKRKQQFSLKFYQSYQYSSVYRSTMHGHALTNMQRCPGHRLSLGSSPAKVSKRSIKRKNFAEIFRKSAAVSSSRMVFTAGQAEAGNQLLALRTYGIVCNILNFLRSLVVEIAHDPSPEVLEVLRNADAICFDVDSTL